MNALSKLVIWSSMIHQLGFLLFSSLDFAIGTVQDAGLIFLSAMANTIANTMLDDDESEKAIVSTTLVLLSLGTFALGIVLVVIGKFGFANAVSFLPVAVVGGYLAFIGYFCVQAGVALCISESLTSVSDWMYLLDPQNLLLAFPGLASGVLLAYVSRTSENEAALPLTMVCIPLLFYLVVFGLGLGLEGAREGGWVGDVAPPVPVSDLFQLVDFSLVRWDLIGKIWSTWVGMVFVVSFASCLDVAAISMDMGEALDTNKELATVGLNNTMSGLTFGFTGSYIFSQTIFTYRTGIHSRWIGILIMGAFLYIVCSPINILQVSPLFFLGATLIFIGFELFYEWLWEIRHQVFLSEYGIIWLTFLAIQIAGIDAGIIIGVFIAIVQQMVLTAKTCTVARVEKRSRAIWTKEQQKILQARAYRKTGPQIITLEISGTIFFGSSLQLFNQILDEVGLQQTLQSSIDNVDLIKGSPHTSSFILAMNKTPSILRDPNKFPSVFQPPKFLILDLVHVHNLDATGTRNCFLQLSKMCVKKGIVVCSAGATPRITWMLRSHKVSFSFEDEEKTKARLQTRDGSSSPCEKILLFSTSQEALEFCENVILYRQHRSTGDLLPPKTPSQEVSGPEERSLQSVISTIIGASNSEISILESLDAQRYHTEVTLKNGEVLFERETHADSFYIVLHGGIANTTMGKRTKFRHKVPVISGAGLVQTSSWSNLSNLDSVEPKDGVGDSGVASLWSVGGVLGYVDYSLDRPRHFRAISTQEGTRVAKVTHSDMNLMQKEDANLYLLFLKLLLQASMVDLSNCTCDDI